MYTSKIEKRKETQPENDRPPQLAFRQRPREPENLE
jgi:hypothetical protein